MNRPLSFMLLFMMASVSFAADLHHPPHKQASILNLSPEVHDLLKKEMGEIRKGMESLVYAVASANWHDVVETARMLKQGYIMKRELTEQQRHELHEELPKHFKEIDMKFHHYAGMLSHVAEERDLDLVHFYIYKMQEACTSCHAKFADAKFTGFKQTNKHMEKHSEHQH